MRPTLGHLSMRSPKGYEIESDQQLNHTILGAGVNSAIQGERSSSTEHAPLTRTAPAPIHAARARAHGRGATSKALASPRLEIGQGEAATSPYEAAAVQFDQARSRLPASFSVGSAARTGRRPDRPVVKTASCVPAHVDIILANRVRGRLFPEMPPILAMQGVSPATSNPAGALPPQTKMDVAQPFGCGHFGTANRTLADQPSDTNAKTEAVSSPNEENPPFVTSFGEPFVQTRNPTVTPAPSLLTLFTPEASSSASSPSREQSSSGADALVHPVHDKQTSGKRSLAVVDDVGSSRLRSAVGESSQHKRGGSSLSLAADDLPRKLSRPSSPQSLPGQLQAVYTARGRETSQNGNRPQSEVDIAVARRSRFALKQQPGNEKVNGLLPISPSDASSHLNPASVPPSATVESVPAKQTPPLVLPVEPFSNPSSGNDEKHQPGNEKVNGLLPISPSDASSHLNPASVPPSATVENLPAKQASSLVLPVEPFSNPSSGNDGKSAGSSPPRMRDPGVLSSSPVLSPSRSSAASLLAWQNRVRSPGHDQDISRLTAEVTSQPRGSLMAIASQNVDSIRDRVSKSLWETLLPNATQADGQGGAQIHPVVSYTASKDRREDGLSAPAHADVYDGSRQAGASSLGGAQTSETVPVGRSKSGNEDFDDFMRSQQVAELSRSEIQSAVDNQLEYSHQGLDIQGAPLLKANARWELNPANVTTPSPTLVDDGVEEEPITGDIPRVDLRKSSQVAVQEGERDVPFADVTRGRLHDFDSMQDEPQETQSGVRDSAGVLSVARSEVATVKHSSPLSTNFSQVHGLAPQQLVDNTVGADGNGGVRRSSVLDGKSGAFDESRGGASHEQSQVVVSERSFDTARRLSAERTLMRALADMMAAVCNGGFRGDHGALDRVGLQVCEDVVRRARIVYSSGLNTEKGWSKRFHEISLVTDPRELTKKLNVLTDHCEDMRKRLKSKDVKRVDIQPLFDCIGNAGIVPLCATVVAVAKELTEEKYKEYGFVETWIYILWVITTIHSDVLQITECIVTAADKAQNVANALKEILVLRVVTPSERRHLQRIVLVMFTPASARPSSKTSKSTSPDKDDTAVEIRSKIVKKPKNEPAVDLGSSSAGSKTPKSIFPREADAAVEVRSKIVKKPKKELAVDPGASSEGPVKPKRRDVESGGFVPVAKNMKKSKQDTAAKNTTGGHRSAGEKVATTVLDSVDDVRVPRVPRAQQFAQQALASFLPTGTARSAGNVDGKLVHSHRDPAKVGSKQDVSTPNILKFDEMKKKVYAPPQSGEPGPRSVYRDPSTASNQPRKRRVTFGGSPSFAAYDDCVTEIVEINSKEADNPFKNVVDVLSPDVPSEFAQAVGRRAGKVTRRMFFSSLGGILSNIGAQRAAKEQLPFSEPVEYFASHMPAPPGATG